MSRLRLAFAPRSHCRWLMAIMAVMATQVAFLTAKSGSPQLRGRCRSGTPVAGHLSGAFSRSPQQLFAGLVLVGTGCGLACRGKAKDAVEAALGPEFFQQLLPTRPGTAKRRKLRPLIVAMGTRGDAEPGFRLAAALKQRGHQPLVVSLDAYKDEAVNRWGLDFRSCGLDKVPLSEEYLTGTTRADQVYSDRGWYGDAWTTVGDRIYRAAMEGTENTEGQGCDVIVTTSMGNTHCLDVAEKLDLLCFALKFCPDIDGQVPTGDFPPSGYPSLPGPLNYLQHVLENSRTVAAVFRGGYIPKVIDFRTQLGMESMEIPGVGMKVPTYSDLRSRQQANQPSLYAFSGALAERPKEYEPWHFITGSFASTSSDAAALPGALDQFLSTGTAPICVAFGSISLARRDEAPYQLRAVRMARRLKQRVLVVDPEVEVEGGDANIFRIRSAPYSVLFPRCLLVVHHGGAGTAQDAIFAELPQLIAPVLKWSDQPFWAKELEDRKLGVKLGEGGLPAPSEADWDNAFQQLLGDLQQWRLAARAVKERMSQEGGVERAVEIIEDVMS